MAIKTIATFLGVAPQRRGHLSYAVQLCVQHNAHLIGILQLPQNSLEHPAFSFVRGSAAIADLLRHQKDRDRATILAAQEQFEQIAAQHGIRHEFRIHMALGEVDERHLGSLHADLVVATSPKELWPDEGPPPDAVQLATGVPFLLVPEQWPGLAPPRNILIGWKTSREARRAIGDALPLLKRADSVTLLLVDPGSDEEPGVEVAMFLSRHGVRLTVETVQSHGGAIADVIAAHALSHGKDLIVLGAYTHRRLTEIVLGGVTRSLLLHAPVPLLIAH
ncbi:MAG: universal stress protein [Bosea sp. (in: a-proteobacteria)]|nr:universal stress protein [Bosea sp. (in: a-proteobacteria)]